MNRSLLIAFALPSIMFYQSNASILYSSEKLIEQVKEEQAIRSFDLTKIGNTLIVSNDPIKEGDDAPAANEIVEEEQPPDQAEEKSSKRHHTQEETDEKTLPKTGKKASEQSARKKSTDSLEAIEQKISALPFAEMPDDKKGERELVRMLANMSGTILYGTKMTETNRQEYITF